MHWDRAIVCLIRSQVIFYSEQPGAWTQVGQFVFPIHFSLQFIDQFNRASSYHAVINMDSQDDDVSIFPFLDKCAMVSLCVVEAQLQEHFHQCLIPVPHALLQAVEGFEKLEYIVFWIHQLISLQLFHETFSLAFKMELRNALSESKLSTGQLL